MRSRSPGGRILAILERLLPAGSPSALYIGDPLKGGPATELEEQRFVADGQSAILSLLGAIWLMPAIGVAALVDFLWGHETSSLALAVLSVPTVFLMTLAIFLQIAKFRRRFDGVQVHFGRFSWTICLAAPIAVAVLIGVA